MNKKELITPFLVAALSLLFVAICFMVFISGGKSKKWVSRKIKIGGILLSLSAISSGTGCISCYDAPSPDYINFIGSDNYSVNIDLDTGNVLSGTIRYPDSKIFSFSISDTTAQQKQTGSLIPIDGAFGSPSETFRLEIDNNLQEGNYQLSIYSCVAEEQNTKHPLQNFTLSVKNE
jgi:hypothetical protein